MRLLGYARDGQFTYHVHKRGQLGQRQSGVEFEVTPDGTEQLLLLHFIHKHFQLQHVGFLNNNIAGVSYNSNDHAMTVECPM